MANHSSDFVSYFSRVAPFRAAGRLKEDEGRKSSPYFGHFTLEINFRDG